MRKVKIVIELDTWIDNNADEDDVKHEIYTTLTELIEEDELSYEVIPSEDEEDEDESYGD